MNFLSNAVDANKPVFVIKYPRNQRAKATAVDGAEAAGFSLLITDRPLKTLCEVDTP